MRLVALLGALLAPVPAWGVAGDGEVGGPAAVGRVSQGGFFACTATLYAPDRAVTAGHCVETWIAGAPDAVLRLPDGDRAIVRVVLHPDHWVAVEADLAVLFLDAASGTTPIPPRAASPGDDWDLLSGRASGWGATSPSDPGGDALRSFDAAMDEVTESSWFFASDTAAVCEGDSGGSLTIEGELAGIVIGGDSDCASWGEALRADVFAAFLADPDGTEPGDRPLGDDDDAVADGSGVLPWDDAADDDAADRGCSSAGGWALLFAPPLGLPRRARPRC